jgi:hypothetical protein
VIATIFQGFVQGVGIVQANVGKVFKLLIPGKGLNIFRGCSPEFNGFFTKDAAQAETNHKKISYLKFLVLLQISWRKGFELDPLYPLRSHLLN